MPASGLSYLRKNYAHAVIPLAYFRDTVDTNVGTGLYAPF